MLPLWKLLPLETAAAAAEAGGKAGSGGKKKQGKDASRGGARHSARSSRAHRKATSMYPHASMQATATWV